MLRAMSHHQTVEGKRLRFPRFGNERFSHRYWNIPQQEWRADTLWQRNGTAWFSLYLLFKKLNWRVKLTVLFTFRFTNKARTPRQYIPRISIPFILIKYRAFIREVSCDRFSNFFNCHRPLAKGQPLQEHPGVGTVFLVNVLQDSVIYYVKTIWEFCELRIYFVSACTFLQFAEL